MARTVLQGYLGVRPGEVVTVEAWSHGLPLARDLVLEARREGAQTILVLEDEEGFFRSLVEGRPPRWPRGRSAWARLPDAYVYLGGPEAFPRLFGLPAVDLEAFSLWPGPVWWRLARQSGVRAAGLTLAGATPTAAATYGVDVDAWCRELLRSSAVRPSRLARPIARIRQALARSRTVRVRHPNGTDLRLELVPGGSWGEDGRVDARRRRTDRFWVQVPTGFVGAAIRPGRTEGIWEANRPAYDRFQRPPVARGSRFSFLHGVLEEFSFDRGGEAFAAASAPDRRNRGAVSALLFGVNPAIVRAPEVTEKAAGAVSLVLGDDRRWGGRRRALFSFVSTIAGAEVELDGRPFPTTPSGSA